MLIKCFDYYSRFVSKRLIELFKMSPLKFQILTLKDQTKKVVKDSSKLNDVKPLYFIQNDIEHRMLIIIDII